MRHNTPHEGDDLLAAIRSHVSRAVPAPLVPVVTELVARSLHTIMTTPSFYLRLVYVQQLNQEIARLQARNQALQEHIRQLAPHQIRKKAPRKASTASGGTRTPPVPKKRPQAPVKATPRTPPRVKKAGTTRAQAFKRGAQGK